MRLLTLSALLILTTHYGRADTVTLLPTDDTVTLESFPEFDYNFGAQRDAPIGTTGSANNLARSRGLFRFDIAAGIPAGSTITGARFRLEVERSPTGPANSNFDMHRMLLPWIEGDKIDNENPGGRLADAGEPTWNNRAHTSTAWGTAGGQSGIDFVTAISATGPVAGVASITLEYNATGIADLQDMLASNTMNFGWLVKTDAEATGKTARRFYMKETLTDLPIRQGTPPQLEVDFDPPAPPLQPPVIITFERDAVSGNLNVEFEATAGLHYELEVTNTLATNSWTMLQSFDPTVSGPITTSVANTGEVRRFVRIAVSDS